MSNSKAGKAQTPEVSPSLLLAGLTLFYTSNFVDRAILNIVAEPIKRDLGLTDTQLGVLGGIAFAAIYAVLGIPLARLAERKSRLVIITVALTVWSIFTMLCGAAANFWQLAFARAGVGVGEAACTPCAHSMIGDAFPPEKRATAISIYSLGIPLGTLAGIVGGAWVAEAYGWRMAFVAVGAPGLLLALVAAFVLGEPARGRYDPPVSDTPPSLSAVVRHLLARPAYRNLLAGVTISTMISAGQGAFAAPYLLRGSFNITFSEVALIMGASAGIAGFVGTLMGGTLADKLSKRDIRLMLRVPAFAYLLIAPTLAVAYSSDKLAVMIGLSLLGALGATVYLGPTFGALHNMVEPRMRATAVAITFLVVSLVGLGIGPVLVGAISDFAAATFYDSPVLCKISSEACGQAGFFGLRVAMVIASLLYLLPAFLYYRASLTLKDSTLSSRPHES